ncbi:Fanconi-associated nuclease 1-like protein, partial [Zea mays]
SSVPSTKTDGDVALLHRCLELSLHQRRSTDARRAPPAGAGQIRLAVIHLAHRVAHASVGSPTAAWPSPSAPGDPDRTRLLGLTTGSCPAAAEAPSVLLQAELKVQRAGGVRRRNSVTSYLSASRLPDVSNRGSQRLGEEEQHGTAAVARKAPVPSQPS